MSYFVFNSLCIFTESNKKLGDSKGLNEETIHRKSIIEINIAIEF